MTGRPFFSIIMASYLSDYGGRYGEAAKDRVAKFHRAVSSVLEQTMQDWELIIIADGCDITMREWHKHIDPRIRCARIDKQRLWSEKVRNAGIHIARGRYIIYLDTDDIFEEDHLQAVRQGLENAGLPAWACFPDLVLGPKRQWEVRICNSQKRGAIGTSNIAHVGDRTVYWPQIQYRWPDNGYDHDWQFALHLRRELGSPERLECAGYRVMHIPRQYDL